MLFLLLVFLNFDQFPLSVDPQSFVGLSREEVIKCYFQSSFSYSEILIFVATFDGVNLTLRHLHCLLREQNLFRRYHFTKLNDIIEVIQKEMLGSGENFVYRTMHQKLRMKGVVTNRETVRSIIKPLDPLGVVVRKSHKLKRRMYTSRGPNFMWHEDSYDKLKLVVFPIHGCIDGYSRKILWLNVSPTNNYPQIIVKYFIECTEKPNLIPRPVRSDRGSENTILGGIQKYLRREHNDAVAGDEIFRYGPFVSNQRIESWWYFFKKSRSSWWMTYFKDLIDEGIYDPTINYQKMCLHLTFSGLLQQELDEIKNM